VLLDHIHKELGGAEKLFQFRRTFSQQWAANCLLQHSFCVAERTPGRVVLIANNGRVIAPEFRITYGNQGFIESPTLPFRLTENLANLIGFPLLEGRFIPSMATTASAIKERRSEMIPILRLLARDDLVAYYTRSMPKSDTKTQEMEKQLSDRALKNASSILARLVECAPTKPKTAKAKDSKEKDEMEDEAKEKESNTDPVDQRVRELVKMARDPEKLSQMPSSYQGWL